MQEGGGRGIQTAGYILRVPVPWGQGGDSQARRGPTVNWVDMLALDIPRGGTRNMSQARDPGH
jgi:hypothetical protein